MDQGNLHLVVTDGKPHDQIELTGPQDIGRAPVRKEVAVDEEDDAIAVEIEVAWAICRIVRGRYCQGGQNNSGCERAIRRRVDRQVLIGKRRAPPAEAAGIGRPIGNECIGIGLYEAASIQRSISFILQTPSPVLDGAGEGIDGVPF